LTAAAKLPAVDGSLLTNVQLLSDANLNTKAGISALPLNTSGVRNAAFGTQALASNTTGTNNQAFGYQALESNTLGSFNTAIGTSALTWNTAADYNIAIGVAALNGLAFANGGVAYQSYNVAIGDGSLMYTNPNSTTTGVLNVGVGHNTLKANTIGARNTALGSFAGSLLTTGNNNISLGYQAGTLLTTGDYNIDIGHVGVAGEGNTIRIGDGNQTKTFISGIRGVGSLTGTQSVVIDANGQMGTLSTAGRFVTVPVTATTGCTTGDFSADASYIYVCIATNSWRRSAAAAW
jgi:hypothetical protein